jgi:hypothetical protein
MLASMTLRCDGVYSPSALGNAERSITILGVMTILPRWKAKFYQIALGEASLAPNHCRDGDLTLVLNFALKRERFPAAPLDVGEEFVQRFFRVVGVMACFDLRIRFMEGGQEFLQVFAFHASSLGVWGAFVNCKDCGD